MTEQKLLSTFSGLFNNEEDVRSSLRDQQAIVGVILTDGRVATYSDALDDHGECVRNSLELRKEVAARICGCKGIEYTKIKIISTNDDLGEEVKGGLHGY